MATHVEVHWDNPALVPVESIPIDRLELLMWRDCFGTIHATGFNADEPEFDDAVHGVLMTLGLNPIIELGKDELDG